MTEETPKHTTGRGARGAVPGRAMRRMKGFEKASGLLQTRVREAGESRGFAVARVLTHWADIAGPALAGKAQPVKIGYSGFGLGATLTVLCSGPNAPFVEMQKETLRQRVNACYGYNAVAKIAITQTAPQGFAEAQALFRSGPPLPEPVPDPKVESAARSASAGVQDPGLRMALEDMARTILSRPKPKGTT